MGKIYTMENFYDILEIPKTANEQEIKKAYRSLSLKHHPDRGGDAEQFKKISEAYETLSDSGKKQQYDRQGSHPFFVNNMGDMGMGDMGMGDMGMGDVNDILNMMFSGRMHSGIRFAGGGINIMPGVRIVGGSHNGFQHMFQQIQKPPPIDKNIHITLQQAYTGCNIPVEITKNNIVNNVQKEETETIYVPIPPGIDENEIILLRDCGNSIDNMVRGDIKIIIGIQNNTQLLRYGLDLVYKSKITLKEALCGFSIELDHLNGKKLTLNNMVNKSVVKPTFKKVVPELGMVRESTKGNLIIEFDIQFPDSLTDEQMNRLSEIL